MTRSLPEGYKAKGYYSSQTHALDSAVLAKKGEVHESYGNRRVRNGEMLLGCKDASIFDAFVEFNISGDPRLEGDKGRNIKGLRDIARELGNKYADPTSPDYISDVHKREKTITDRIMVHVHDTYGDYSDETSKTDTNTGERKAKGWISDGTVYLKDMEKGSLVCRHYAPILSVLLDDARIPNHLVSSSAPEAVLLQNGAYQLDPKADFTSAHMYVVTKGGNAVVEGTAADQYANGKVGHAYKPILNGVSVDDIVYKGHAALTSHSAYGGHSGNGKYDPEEIRKAKADTLARYNESALRPFAAAALPSKEEAPMPSSREAAQHGTPEFLELAARLILPLLEYFIPGVESISSPQGGVRPDRQSRIFMD